MHLVDQGKPVNVIFLNFSKAFNIVFQSILMNKISSKQLDEIIMWWVSNWLMDWVGRPHQKHCIRFWHHSKREPIRENEEVSWWPTASSGGEWRGRRCSCLLWRQQQDPREWHGFAPQGSGHGTRLPEFKKCLAKALRNIIWFLGDSVWSQEVDLMIYNSNSGGPGNPMLSNRIEPACETK